MRTIRLSDLPGTRSIDMYGSNGFTVASLSLGGHVSVASLAAGGRIGSHQAAVDQCLVVLSGRAMVSGQDGLTVEVAEGEAVIWDSGEVHETKTESGLLALVLEAEGLTERFR